MHLGPLLPWTCVALTAGLFAAGWHATGLSKRVSELEGRPIAHPDQLAALERRAQGLERELRGAEAAVDELSATAARQREVSASLHELQLGLAEAACRIEEQSAELVRVSALEQEIGPKAIEQRFVQFGASVEQRWQELGQLATNAEKIAASARAGLEIVERELEHDPDGMWNHLLGPTVQVSGAETVGTGVLVAAQDGSEGVWILTAWHVIRDLYSGEDANEARVEVAIYSRDARPRLAHATLVEQDAVLDVALLRLEAGVQATAMARLAPRARLTKVRVFDRIYAVGCPLGNDPIPTFGEVSDVHHEVDGQGYWMVSAPTYIGNSGGGIFDAASHELLALFTKIYTHGTVRPAVVPHMGLATPLTAVYDWLERTGHASLEPRDAPAAPRTASAVRSGD